MSHNREHLYDHWQLKPSNKWLALLRKFAEHKNPRGDSLYTRHVYVCVRICNKGGRIWDGSPSPTFEQISTTSLLATWEPNLEDVCGFSLGLCLLVQPSIGSRDDQGIILRYETIPRWDGRDAGRVSRGASKGRFGWVATIDMHWAHEFFWGFFASAEQKSKEKSGEVSESEFGERGYFCKYVLCWEFSFPLGWDEKENTTNTKLIQINIKK